MDETTASTNQTLNSNEKRSINLVKSENQELELDSLVLRSLNEVLHKQAREWAQEGKGPNWFNRTEHLQHNCKRTSMTVEDGMHTHTVKALYGKRKPGH